MRFQPGKQPFQVFSTSCPVEVLSKFQIRFKGSAKRDYISNLKKIKVCIKRQADRESAVRLRRMSIYRRPVLHLNLKNKMRIPHSGATHKVYKIRREIPQRGATQALGLRWGFETTSSYLISLNSLQIKLPSGLIRHFWPFMLISWSSSSSAGFSFWISFFVCHAEQ